MRATTTTAAAATTRRGGAVSRGFARDDDARARERRGDGETGAQGDHRQ